MANNKKKWPVMPPILKAGFPQRFPEECGTVAPTDKKTEKLRACSGKSTKNRRHKKQG